MRDAGDRLDAAVVALRAAQREVVDAIRAARATGMTLREIADRAGVSHEQIRRITRHNR